MWTGKAYREFSVWRENYPGGLTELEEDFATAMTNHAKRRKRRRRVAVAAAFVVLLAGLAVVGSFWQRSTHEARRAEAANLVSLGQLELDIYPSATVAHAIASLELADSQAARRLALEALWLGPTALVVNDLDSWKVRFSADGDRMVQSTVGVAAPIHVIDKNGEWNSFDTSPEWVQIYIFVDPPGKHLLTRRWATSQAEQHLILWSIPDGEKLAEARYEAPAALLGLGWNEDRAVLLIAEGGEVNLDTMSFDGTIEHLASPDLDFDVRQWYQQMVIDRDNGQWLAVIDDGTVMVHEILDEGLSPPRILGRHDGEVVRAFIDPRGQTLATKDSKGTVRLWDIEGESPPRVVQFPAESY